ncbi:cytochrome P450 [Mycena floridula]|nr:cytochrome P450 [Mycena floridula]
MFPTKDNPLTIVVASLICGSVIALAYIYIYSSVQPVRGDLKRSIPLIKGLPLLGCTGFLNRRNDFIQETMHFVQDTLCEIYLPRCRVILMRGLEAQTTFFNQKGLSLQAGYLLLHPAGVGDWTGIQGMPSTPSGPDLTWFYSRLTAVLRKGILMNRYPLLLEDLDNAQASLPQKGPVDIFHMCHSMILQLLIRTMCPQEISGDPIQARNVGSLFGLVAGETNPLRFAFPWVPGIGKLTQLYYGPKLYMAFRNVVKRRQEQNVKPAEPDVVDLMIERGDSLTQIISFLLGATFAGLINTARIQGWLLIYLFYHPEWRNKIKEELNEFLAEHSQIEGPGAIHQVPFEALKGDGALLRQNLGDKVRVGERIIPSGHFLAYPMSDIHHNPLIHPNPGLFDPGRNLAVEGQGITFIGFGAGRHPCPGKDLAMVLTKIVLCNFLVKFDYTVVDKKGSPLLIIPASEKNSLHMPGLAAGEEAFCKFNLAI